MKELKILSETEEPLFSRKAVKAKILFDGATPSREVVKEALGKTLKADTALIAITRIDTLYGQNEAILLCRVYSDAGAMKAVERNHFVARGLKKEDKKEE